LFDPSGFRHQISKDFFDVVGSEMMANELNIDILRSLSRRCILPVSPTGVNDRVVYKEKCFVPESGSPLCGIISSLSKNMGVMFMTRVLLILL
jgi:hypothetical protein